MLPDSARGFGMHRPLVRRARLLRVRVAHHPPARQVPRFRRRRVEAQRHGHVDSSRGKLVILLTTVKSNLLLQPTLRLLIQLWIIGHRVKILLGAIGLGSNINTDY